MKRIGEEYVRRELVFTPARCEIYEYYTESYGCPNCKEGNGDTEKAVITKSKAAPALIGKGPASPSTVAMDDLPEVCKRPAPLPPGKGLEGIRGSHQPYDPCQLDHLQCGALFPSTVRLLPPSASAEGVPHGGRNPGTGSEGTRAKC